MLQQLLHLFPTHGIDDRRLLAIGDPKALFKQCRDQTLTFGVEFLLAVVGPLSKAPRIVTDHPHHMQQLTLQVTSEIRKCFDDRLLVRHVPPHFVWYLTGQNEQEPLINLQ